MATNVQIPIDNAGIGDAIAIKNNTPGEDKSHFICVVGSTVSATAPSGYTWYGTVYGRERGGLMVQSITYYTEKWANTSAANESVGITSSSHPNVYATTIGNSGLQRNGLPSYNDVFVCMSVQQIKEQFSGSNSTALHPTCPYTGGTASLMPMSEANFNKDVSKAKTIYGTYENYLAQMLPIMKGSKSGVFSKRCGKLNTYEMSTTFAVSGHSFPAAGICYRHKVKDENANHWWLPDMYELAVMMSDSSHERWKYAHSVLGGNTARTALRWSCIRLGDKHAWIYNDVGVSSYDGYFDVLTVVPVTLIPL